MVKYKFNNRSQLEMRIVDYTAQLIPGSLEYTIDYLLENRIDLSGFDGRYNNHITGAPAYSPKIILKVILYAYSNGILGSRKIEQACKENVIFMSLAGGHSPHFTYIADFIHRFDCEIRAVFNEVLLICSELGLIGGKFMAVDGCKLPSNAAKEYSGTFAELQNKEKKIRKTVSFLLAKHKESDKNKSENNLKDQIKSIEARADKIKKFLANNEPRLGPRGKEIQSNITDNESARLKSSHGWVQGYNGLALVDSKNQVIINGEVFGGNNEGMFLKGFLENTRDLVTENRLEKKYSKSTLLADTGFFSEDNLKYLSDTKIKSYIPDQYYRKRDPRFITKVRHNTGKRKGYFGPDDFKFHKKENAYRCPSGKTLPFKRMHKIGNTHGKRYEARPSDCQACELKLRCLKTKTTRYRTIYVTLPKYDQDYVKDMMNKVDSEQGRQVYSKRMGIVEPVFANICHAKGMNRFNYRKKQKVNSQWLLYCMVHNIGKIANVLKI